MAAERPIFDRLNRLWQELNGSEAERFWERLGLPKEEGSRRLSYPYTEQQDEEWGRETYYQDWLDHQLEVSPNHHFWHLENEMSFDTPASGIYPQEGNQSGRMPE